MAFRDRLYTATTAKALLSWRLGLGAAVAIVLVLLDLSPVAASLVGLVAYGLAVLLAMPKAERTASIDPFTLSEPWRHFVQGAQRARQALAQTVRGVAAGPLRDRLADIARRFDKAVEESWRIARRGDQIDQAVKRIDPVRLRSRLATLQAQAQARPADGSDTSADALAHPAGAMDEAVASVEGQLATAERLKALSARTADQLRLTQARLDELVARATEVTVGGEDTDTYASDVDDLVVELEALRQAVAETEAASGAAGPAAAGP